MNNPDAEGRGGGLGSAISLLAAVGAGMLPIALGAQGVVSLPELTVYSTRVANQSSAAAFAMPVSALRYEPRVDIQGRNLAEGQADITIRGGIFENTGMQIGAVTIGDSQTGHYLAEVPVAPVMLGGVSVVTGADLALGAANATVGAVAYGWRPIRTSGTAAIAMGEDNFRQAEFYQGYSGAAVGVGGRVGVDVALARSQSDGAVPLGDHDFSRANVRLQLARGTAQTDVFAGYQAKQFGWPNLYTPFGSPEAENLQTTLLVLNHRMDGAGGDFVEAGLLHRRNKDDYAFNRFAPLGAVHPFQHTTWLTGGAVGARRHWSSFSLDLRAELLADKLASTSLTAGRYRTRTMSKFTVLGGRKWRATDGGEFGLRAGATLDDSNRGGGELSPVVELAREFPSARLQRIHAGFTQTTQLPSYTALNASATAGLFRGNANLGRSVSQNLEVGAAGKVGDWSTEAAAFFRRDRALVDWTFRRGVTARTANAVDLGVAGFELVARRSLPMCDVVIGYTALGKGADYRGAAVDASFYALNYARHRLTAALTLRLGAGWELRIDNAARRQAANLLRVNGGKTALATAASLVLRPAAVRGLELSLRVDNAWNDTFQEVPAVPAPPRRMALGAGFTW